MYRLVATDLDGTLLDGQHRLGTFTRDLLNRLNAHGVRLVIASGRHYRDIHGIAAQLDAMPWLISSNGAAVHDTHAAVCEHRPIPAQYLDFLLFDPLFAEAHLNIYRDDDWLVAKPNPELLRYHQDSGFAYRCADLRQLDAKPVLKVFYFHRDRQQLARMESTILQRHGDALATTQALPEVLEVMAHGVSKGAALCRLMQRLKVDPSELIAFGDGRNDIEMLECAGTACLTNDAAPQLRAALPHLPIIGSNHNEAVAHHLAKLFDFA